MTALYRTEITHERRAPVHHGFRYRHVMWLVDLDDVPRARGLLRWFGRFEARDHLGDPDATIRENVDAFLAGRGVDLGGGRVLMLTNPRSLGCAFNPLTVYWCYAAGGPDRAPGPLRCVVAEVHNTYGDRHCYLLEPDGAGRASADKDFLVSPFFAVDGRYEMRFGEPGAEVEVAITLRRGENMEPVFRAQLAGRRTAARVRSFGRATVRHAGGSWRVIARIRWQGLRLWARRVPLVARPVHTR